MPHARLSPRFLPAALRLLLLLAGAWGLATALTDTAAREVQAEQDAADRVLAAAADKAAAGLGELAARFDRATAGLRAADLQADLTTLSARLLRAEPAVAPAVGLAVLNARGRQVASTTPGSPQGDEAAGQWLLGALDREGRAAVILALPPADPASEPLLVIARRIEDGPRLAGAVLSALPMDALRAAAEPPRNVSGLVAATVTRDGRVLLRVAPTRSPEEGGLRAWLARVQPQAWLPEAWPVPDWLRAPLLPPARVAAAEVTAGGLRWTGTLDPALLGSPGEQPAQAVLGFGVTGLALLGLLLLPRGTGGPDRAAQEEAERLRVQLREAETRRDRMLAAIGHDVRTPISSILGISALLMDGTLDEGQRRWMQRIRASCEALLAMLNGMLEIAAAKMNGADVQREPVDVATLTEEVGEVLRPQAHDKGLELRIRIGAEALGLWSTDPTRLRQVLFNLAGNAVKYTARGSVQLDLSVARQEGGAERLCFHVSDTGPGIPDAERERVFEQFCRGSSAAEGGESGLGLGLALCREIAGLLDARLSLDSAVGVGSVFTFDMPAARVVQAGRRASPMAGRTALVVGLSEGVRRRTASHLEHLGFLVETAADGFMAIGMAERAAFEHGCLDLAVVDGGMAGLTPAALVARLQGGPAGHRTRTAVVSNDRDRMGADAVLPHPVEAQTIERVVIGLFGTTTVLQEVDPRARPAASLRVLVVEDNRINQALFLDVLARAGFSAFAASSGEEGAAAAVRGGFDVVLMDVQMPGIDGCEATRRIRAAEDGVRVPVVGLTAHTGANIRRQCLDAGMDVVLHKPADLTRLPLRLREAVTAARAGPSAAPDAAGSGTEAALDIADESLEALLRQVGTDRVRSCIHDFLTDTPGQLAALPGLLGNLPALERLAHDLAGVSGTLGAASLLDGLLLVEDAARRGDAAQAGTAVTEVLATWVRVQPALQSRFEAIVVRQSGQGLRDVA